MPKVVSVDHLSISVSDFKKSKEFYGKLLKFLGFKVLDEYDDAIGWTNGKTRLWISSADEEGKKHRYRFGNIGFHHYAFRLDSPESVDKLEKLLKKMGPRSSTPQGNITTITTASISKILTVSSLKGCGTAGSTRSITTAPRPAPRARTN